MSTVPGMPTQAMNSSGTAAGAIFVGMQDGKFPFAATLNLLARRDLAKTLAEPTLVAMSGQEASFLSGGEFPFETSAGLGATSIEFKPFGIQLAFSPTVMSDSTIQLQTKVSVSAPDSTTSITTGGRVTQGFKSRQAATTVRLRDGQSFVIAGLLSDEIENSLQKVPGLGDIPILGTLFSSKSFSRKETELIVVVTARLVNPLDPDDVPRLPGEDRISDPTDLELFLLNVTEPNAKVENSRRQQQRRAQSMPMNRTPVGRVGFWR
jgi:pilus assembly protein CpaC